jgi:Acetyltransferases
MTARENLTVEMVRRDLSDLPEAPLLPGFAFRPFAPGDEGVWTEIIRQSEQFFIVRDDLYAGQFGQDPEGARERIVFIRDEATGADVATIAAWYGEERHDDRAGWGRIHWVAVRPAYQGRGLGKAMLAYALRRLVDLGHHNAFLVTSTGRLPALRLYLNFGFVPDRTRPNAANAWGSIAGDLPAATRYLKGHE